MKVKMLETENTCDPLCLFVFFFFFQNGGSTKRSKNKRVYEKVSL